MTALVDRAQFGGKRSGLPAEVRRAPTTRSSTIRTTRSRERFLGALGADVSALPARGRAARSRSRACARCFAIPTLGYSRAGAADARPACPGVFLVNSAQIVNGTLNVNETVRLAERAVDALLIGGRTAGADLTAPRRGRDDDQPLPLQPLARPRQPVVVHEDARRPRLGALSRRTSTLVPQRARRCSTGCGLRITFFIVGQDAAGPRTASRLRRSPRPGTRSATTRSTTSRGCTCYSNDEIADELARAEDAIEAATGVRPERLSRSGLQPLGSRARRAARARLPLRRLDASDLPRSARARVLLHDGQARRGGARAARRAVRRRARRAAAAEAVSLEAPRRRAARDPRHHDAVASRADPLSATCCTCRASRRPRRASTSKRARAVPG